MQLKDSLGNLLEERRQKITISAVTAWQELTADFVAKEEGEVTVFIDNSDTEPVFFDNLELRVETAPTLVITQEHHYYPFGMNMSGIERQGDLMYQFNGMVEKEQAFGLELYETPFRSYDAQLGRFWQVEPLADEFHSISMFQFGFNNPISANDPSGLRTIYTLTGPEKVRGLSDFISDREAREKNQGQHYNWDTGRYENGRGQALSWESVYGSLEASGLLKDVKILRGAATNGKNGYWYHFADRQFTDTDGASGVASRQSIFFSFGDDTPVPSPPNKPGPIKRIIDKLLPIVWDGLKSIAPNDGEAGANLDLYYSEKDNDTSFGLDFEAPWDQARFTMMHDMKMIRIKGSTSDRSITKHTVSGLGLSFSGIGFEYMEETNDETHITTRRGALKFHGFYLETKGVDGGEGGTHLRIGFKYTLGGSAMIGGFKFVPVNIGLGWKW
ncbi:RHS repeat domain-containing protein [Bernardetia sp. OM2101]|uniref:RHS repeat domain-containing protein n=1 Tax=Bernardetia sp. OM2101 TaxID=3344876 RepID=UPI0035D121B3